MGAANRKVFQRAAFRLRAKEQEDGGLGAWEVLWVLRGEAGRRGEWVEEEDVEMEEA